jgi:ABC-type sulfate transport system substrate-binding protein
MRVYEAGAGQVDHVLSFPVVRPSPNVLPSRDPKIAAKYASSFATVKLVTIDQHFGRWGAAQKTHVADGGTFDQAYRPGIR